MLMRPSKYSIHTCLNAILGLGITGTVFPTLEAASSPRYKAAVFAYDPAWGPQ